MSRFLRFLKPTLSLKTPLPVTPFFPRQSLVSALSTRSSLVNKRFYSEGPEPLAVEEIENRVLQVLKDFSKVDASKVMIIHNY
jgi:hypothetical protein